MASAEELALILRAEGTPEGAWLLDLSVTRRNLRLAWEEADDLLGRLQSALVDKRRDEVGGDLVG
jgi:hypothetical protein